MIKFLALGFAGIVALCLLIGTVATLSVAFVVAAAGIALKVLVWPFKFLAALVLLPFKIVVFTMAFAMKLALVFFLLLGALFTLGLAACVL